MVISVVGQPSQIWPALSPADGGIEGCETTQVRIVWKIRFFNSVATAELNLLGSVGGRIIFLHEQPHALLGIDLLW